MNGLRAEPGCRGVLAASISAPAVSLKNPPRTLPRQPLAAVHVEYEYRHLIDADRGEARPMIGDDSLDRQLQVEVERCANRFLLPGRFFGQDPGNYVGSEKGVAEGLERERLSLRRESGRLVECPALRESIKDEIPAASSALGVTIGVETVGPCTRPARREACAGDRSPSGVSKKVSAAEATPTRP